MEYAIYALILIACLLLWEIYQLRRQMKNQIEISEGLVKLVRSLHEERKGPSN